MKKAEREARIAGIYEEAERIAKHRGTTTAAQLREWVEDHRWRAENNDAVPEDVKTASLAAELTEAALARAEEAESSD